MFDLLVNRQVARGGATGVHGLSQLSQLAVLSHLVGKDLSIVESIFRTRVDNVANGMMAGKGWIDYCRCVSLNVQQDQTAVARMESIDV